MSYLFLELKWKIEYVWISTVIRFAASGRGTSFRIWFTPTRKFFNFRFLLINNLNTSTSWKKIQFRFLSNKIERKLTNFRNPRCWIKGKLSQNTWFLPGIRRDWVFPGKENAGTSRRRFDGGWSGVYASNGRRRHKPSIWDSSHLRLMITRLP